VHTHVATADPGIDDASLVAEVTTMILGYLMSSGR
jgi:hypothetical protein